MQYRRHCGQMTGNYCMSFFLRLCKNYIFKSAQLEIQDFPNNDFVHQMTTGNQIFCL